MKLTHLTYSLLSVLVHFSIIAAQAQDLPNVPRDRTLISQGWDYYNQVPSPTNFSPYAGVLLHQRNNLHYTVNEMLFYTNHNDNKIIRGRLPASNTTRTSPKSPSSCTTA